MSDSKHTERTPRIPLKAKKEEIISDHLLQVADDKDLGLSLGTFNASWNAACMIEDIDAKKQMPTGQNYPERVRRSVQFLNNVKGNRSNLAIIALQESANTPAPDVKNSKEKINELSRALTKLQNKRSEEQQGTTREQRKATAPAYQAAKAAIEGEKERLTNGNFLWDAANIEQNLSIGKWNKITQDGVANAILYDANLVEPVELKIDLSGLDEKLASRVQVAAFKKKEKPNFEAFIVYNVHFRHNDDPAITEEAISQIQHFSEKYTNTYYIMGDFNGRFPSTKPKLVDNGTCVIPQGYSQNSRDYTDAILKKSDTLYQNPIRLHTQIANFETGELEDLPEVSLEEAEKDPFYSPVCYGENHDILRYDDIDDRLVGEKAEDLIYHIKIYLSPQKIEVGEEKLPAVKASVFLEKNNFNLSRIAINTLHLSSSQTALLNTLGVPVEKERRPAYDMGEIVPERFVLYPHKPRDYQILLDLPSLLKALESKIQSSLNLKQTAKFIGAAAAVSTAISIAFFAASILFVPAVFLAAGAGLLAVAAAVIYRLGKYRGDYLLGNEKPLSYGLAAVGTTIAVGALLTLFLAPAVVFAGIAAAPAMLAFAVAAIFLAAALAAFTSKPVVPDVGGGVAPAENDGSHSELHVVESKSSGDIALSNGNSLKARLLKGESDSYGATGDRKSAGPTPSSKDREDVSKRALITSTSTHFGSPVPDSDSSRVRVDDHSPVSENPESDEDGPDKGSYTTRGYGSENENDFM